MTELSTEQLKKSFHKEMIDLYKKMIKLVKHKPTRLMDFINKYGGYEAAVKYLSTESNVQDFAILWEKERLDLSVEALITNEMYRSLFSEEMLEFCDRKLREYSYAPNKIEEVAEPTGYYDEDEKIDLAELLKNKEMYLPKETKKAYVIYKEAVAIGVEEWKALLLNTKVVTANNLDMLLHIYAIGDEVGPSELAKEEGYSSTYPYKEVTMALGKRIKAALKIDVPTGKDGKPLWWHILFNGGLKDNSDFEWSLKNDLRQAIAELISEGKIEEVIVNSNKEVKHIEEKGLKIVGKDTSIHSTKVKEDDGLSDFDRLFASIMETPKKAVKEEIKEEPKVAMIEKVEKAPVSEVVNKLPEVQVEPKKMNDQLQKSLEEKIEVRQEEPLDHKEKLKKECLDYYGAICDICGFDFGYTYGEAYEKYIEVHNIHSDGKEEILETTHPTEDLIPICCNCHHVMHSTNPPLSVEQMRNMVKA